MKEATETGWSVRQMERQINVFYYERIIASNDANKNDSSVKDEANTLRNEWTGHGGVANT